MDQSTPYIRKLENTPSDRELFEAFDEKLGDYEKSLDERMVKSEHIAYNNPHNVLKASDCAAFVAEINGIPVGYIVGKTKKFPPWYGSEPYGYIETMYVDEEYRKKGYATELFLTIKEWFAKRGVTTLQLRLFSKNTAAVKLYTKWGFEDMVTEMILRKKNSEV